MDYYTCFLHFFIHNTEVVCRITTKGKLVGEIKAIADVETIEGVSDLFMALAPYEVIQDYIAGRYMEFLEDDINEMIYKWYDSDSKQIELIIA